MQFDQHWTDLLYEMSNGSAVEMNTLLGTEVFKFFGILRTFKNRQSA